MIVLVNYMMFLPQKVIVDYSSNEHYFKISTNSSLSHPPDYTVQSFDFWPYWV